MRIVIPTIGSRGDVQPFIALAQGLNRAGHRVTLASHPMMKDLVESHEVDFSPIGPNIDLAHEVAVLLQNSPSAAVGLFRVMQFSFKMLQYSHHDILALCNEADLVIISAQSAAGKNEAEIQRVPYLSVTLMPWAIPWDDPDRPFLRRTLYRLIDRLVGLITTRPLNRIRKQQGLPPVGREGFTSLRLNLVPVSPTVYDPNPLWEARHRVTGYWFVEEIKGWQPAADLLAFLDAGEPPIVISLGAMSLGEKDEKEVVKLFTDAIQEVGCRAIIQGWDAGAQQSDLPSSIHAAGAIPHSWLLPRCAAIVHHGGFGTTSAGLRAGIPALVIPHIADQFFWANIIYDLGAGPKPVPRRKLSKATLVAALNELVHNNDFQLAASSSGEKIRYETGVDNAVRMIEEEFC
jgi:sterol 3beta-glucosyltransferase